MSKTIEEVDYDLFLIKTVLVQVVKSSEAEKRVKRKCIKLVKQTFKYITRNITINNEWDGEIFITIVDEVIGDLINSQSQFKTEGVQICKSAINKLLKEFLDKGLISNF